MKRKFRKYTSNFVLVILALQILNMSVSCRIADDSFFSQIDDSVNITDHALEYIVENVMGFSNAFPEVKENKQEHSASPGFPKGQEFILFSFQPKLGLTHCPVLINRIYSPLVVNPYFEYFLKIIPPPPKTV